MSNFSLDEYFNVCLYLQMLRGKGFEFMTQENYTVELRILSAYCQEAKVSLANITC